MLEIQILGTLFGLLMAYFSFVNYKKKQFKTLELAFWGTLWAIFIILILAPSIIDPIIETFQFARRLDVYIILGFMFVIGLTYYNYITTQKTNKKVEDIVKEIAFQNAKKKK